MIKDYFKFAFENLRKRKLRTALTMLGIFVGIAAVVSLVSLGQGLQKYVDDEFEKLGRDKIIIQPKGSFGPGTSSSNPLEEKDLKAIKSIPSIVDSAGMIVKSIRMEHDDEVRYLSAIALPTDESRELIDELFLNYDVEYGRTIKKGDKYKVFLGHYFYDSNVFTKNLKLGDKVLINDVQFEVIGFLEALGNPSDDQQVYLPEETMLELYPELKGEYFSIVAKFEKGENPLVMVDRIERKLRSVRDVDEGNEDFSVQTTEDLVKTFNTILNVVQVVLVGIASISLVVGGIGIMNTMYTAILERTKEIGIMKAIGARNSDIFILFLIESGTLGLSGGAIGILIGAGFSMAIELIATAVLQTALLQAYFPWYLIVGMMVFSFVVGALSGILPAIQASRQNPVDALRYE